MTAFIFSTFGQSNPSQSPSVHSTPVSSDCTDERIPIHLHKQLTIPESEVLLSDVNIHNISSDDVTQPTSRLEHKMSQVLL